MKQWIKYTKYVALKSSEMTTYMLDKIYYLQRINGKVKRRYTLDDLTSLPVG